MSDPELAIVLVYPELLGLYGDRGNALALQHRSSARGVPSRILTVEAGEPVPEQGDIYLVGGGEDGSMLVAAELLSQQHGLRRALDRGAGCLAVCAGLQLLSEEYVGPDGVARQGLGPLDVRCGRMRRRAVGEVLSRPVNDRWGMLTGYENHLGDARLGPAVTPLGRVVEGVGNGHLGLEGACAKGILATYLHGPLLPRNPDVADHLLARALGVDLLPPLDEPEVARLRAELLRQHGRRRRWPFSGRREGHCAW